jgi:transcriptional regulator with XRE-family HTH domain
MADAHRKQEDPSHVENGFHDHGTSGNENGVVNGRQPLHRISEVRKREGISLRSVSRRWKMEVSRVRELEDENNDLSLSELYQWQQILDVPVAELLIDEDQPLSAPILRRAQMIRLMKTAATLTTNSRSPQVQSLAQNLMDQLAEMMPELNNIGPWQEDGDELNMDTTC